MIGPVAHVEVMGLPLLMETLVKGGAEAPAMLAAALLEEAHIAFRISQVEVPYRTGVLKGSGRVSAPAIVGSEVVVEVSYGGAALAYAYVMHRGLTKAGNPIHYRNGKKAQYLSDPILARLPGMDTRIAERVQVSLNAL